MLSIKAEEIEKEIEAHTEMVLMGKNSPDNSICPNCKCEPIYFSVHEKRPRIFQIIIGRLVRRINSYLIRWKCPDCKGSFTEYPSFAFPYKRYVKYQVLKKSFSYAIEWGLTYREGTKEEGMAIAYESQEEAIDDRNFSHSTLWCWVGFIGNMAHFLLTALSRIKEKESSSSIFREIVPINPRKYKSEDRKGVLETCTRLLFAELEYEKIYEKKSIFSPDF